MITPPRPSGLTVRLRVEALEERSPASSLLDLATLGLMAGDPPSPSAPTSRPAPTTWDRPAGATPTPQPLAIDDAAPPPTRHAAPLAVVHPADGHQPDLPDGFVNPCPGLMVWAQPGGLPVADSMAAPVAAGGDVGTARANTPPAVASPPSVVEKPTGGPVAVSSAASGSGPVTSGSTHTPETQLMSGHVKSVTYSGDHLITVVADPGDDPFPDPPHWYDDNANGQLDEPADHSIPLGYVRGDTPIVAATFHGYRGDPSILLPEWKFSDTILARGYGPTQTGSNCEMDVPATAVSASGDDLSLAPTAMTYPFGNVVDYFDSFTITWQLSFTERVDTGERGWQDAGASSNELFVTFDTPSSTSYYTVIYTAVTPAVGADNLTEIQDCIFDYKFASRNAVKVYPKNLYSEIKPPVPLKYYGNWNIDGTKLGVEPLLERRDGTCDNWSEFFIACIKQHNKDTQPKENVGVQKFVVSKVSNERLAVNNWSFQAAGNNNGNNKYTHGNTLKGGTAYALQPNAIWAYEWAQATVDKPRTGIPGQNQTDPLATFRYHAIVSVRNVVDGNVAQKYYDPSYGVRYNTVQEIDDVFAAFWIPQSVNGVNKYLFRINPPGVDINVVVLRPTSSP